MSTPTTDQHPLPADLLEHLLDTIIAAIPAAPATPTSSAPPAATSPVSPFSPCNRRMRSRPCSPPRRLPPTTP